MAKKIKPTNSNISSHDIPKKLVGGLMNRELPDDIRAEIQEWFKSEVSENEKYDALEEIFNELEEDTQYNEYVERCLIEQHKRLGFPSGNKKQTGRFRKFFSQSIQLRAAAVLLPLFILYGIYLYINMNTAIEITEISMNTVTGEDTKKDIILPDNTAITLEGDALVRYADNFTQNREVYLDGEAFFSVTHIPEKPFIVRSNSITVTVYGTEFHMKAYANMPTAEVKLTTGSVIVTAEGIEETVMTPGQHFVYNRSHRTITLDDIGEGEMLRLRKQSLKLEGHSLDEAFRMMAGYFSMQFRVDPGIDLTERIAIPFEDDIKPEEALSLIQKISNTRFDYKIEADTVTLKKRKNNIKPINGK